MSRFQAFVLAGVAVLFANLSSGTQAAVTLEWVDVGNPGNPDDPFSGNEEGGVAYSYRIAKTELTIGVWAEFLNTIDPDGANLLGLWDARMASNLNSAGIQQDLLAAPGSRYVVVNNNGNSANRPITYVDFFCAARFANWLHNGQGGGDTEDGAYRIRTVNVIARQRAGGVSTLTTDGAHGLQAGDQVSVTGVGGSGYTIPSLISSVTETTFSFETSSFYSNEALVTNLSGKARSVGSRKVGALYALPTFDEWYKAAYYDPSPQGPSDRYWKYPVRTDNGAAVGNFPSLTGKGANFRILNGDPNGDGNSSDAHFIYGMLLGITYSSTTNYLADVDAFANGASYYGTLNQGGNVSEWTEQVFGGERRVVGGSWLGAGSLNVSGLVELDAQFFLNEEITLRRPDMGVRLVRPGSGAVVPPPTVVEKKAPTLTIGKRRIVAAENGKAKVKGNASENTASVLFNGKRVGGAGAWSSVVKLGNKSRIKVTITAISTDGVSSPPVSVLVVRKK